jgi:CO dehydrogenase nickel-insertion accessory protein CooC1
LAAEIGLRKICYVANKIASTADEQFVRNALEGKEIIGVIPWSDEIRSAERHGRPVLAEAGRDLVDCFEAILQQVQPATGKGRKK